MDKILNNKKINIPGLPQPHDSTQLEKSLQWCKIVNNQIRTWIVSCRQVFFELSSFILINDLLICLFLFETNISYSQQKDGKKNVSLDRNFLLSSRLLITLLTKWKEYHSEKLTSTVTPFYKKSLSHKIIKISYLLILTEISSIDNKKK